MYDVTDAIKKAYKPFDVVICKSGSVGFIQEVNVNPCQDKIENQLSYAVCWIFGKETKHAWWRHEELQVQCNLFVKIAECMCHPFGGNEEFVGKVIFGGRDEC